MTKVLIADDDEQMRGLIEELLAQNGYHVFQAPDGEKALEIARAEKPEVLVLDLAMPKKNGYEVCKAIRADGDGKVSSMKIIVTSGKKYPLDIRAAQEVGADDYLTKPYPARELLVAIESLLGGTSSA